MELSVLLAEQIVVIFLMMAIGYVYCKNKIIQNGGQQCSFQSGGVYMLPLCDHQFLPD